jgi:hypothetical protein
MLHNRDLFIQAPECYSRNLDIIEESILTYAHFFHLKSGNPMDVCVDYIRKKTSAGEKFELKPITLMGLQQDENGDRVVAHINFHKFITSTKRNRHILTPNVALYYHPDVKQSPLVKYIKGKKKKRKAVKRAGQIAEQLGDYEEFAINNNLEYAIKILTNSLSGAHASKYNPLWNESAHSTLTSISRVFVSYSNASTERFLMGNRHYWSKDVVLENILTITRNTDYVALKQIVDKYNLHIPTADEVMEMIERSTTFYWYSQQQLLDIRLLVSKLNKLQRVSFLYTGDFYSLYTLNDSFVREFLDDLMSVSNVIDNYPDANLDDIVAGTNTGIASLACIYCMEFLKGSMVSKVKVESPENYRVYVNTILHIELTLLKYEDLLVTFYRTENLPSSIFSFPSSIRRAVIGSDTDSVMYTVQQQVIWKYGRLELGPDTPKFSNTISFLNNVVVDHCLVVIGKQMGVADSELLTLRMKNEFEFYVYMRANRAKHYATLMTSKEGLVFSKPRSEIKGVGLKDSKIPKFVMSSLDDELVKIMTLLSNDGTIEAFPVMQRIANFEHLIYQSLLKGDITYLVGININTKEGYKNPMSSNYLHYKLWTEVFAPIFGNISEPPYRAVKVSTVVGKKKLFAEWLATAEKHIAEPLMAWMADNNKDCFKQILLPLEIVAGGVPKEFLSMLDLRSTVADISAGYYIVLEMMGFYFDNVHNTQLVSDRMPYREEFGLPGGRTIESIIGSSMEVDDDEEDAFAEFTEVEEPEEED